jgi:hypothetical protein
MAEIQVKFRAVAHQSQAMLRLRRLDARCDSSNLQS